VPPAIARVEDLEPIGAPVLAGQADADDPWMGLRAGLVTAVDAATAARPRIGLPLGRWLDSDLTLAVHARYGGVRATAARCLGVPQTTFARRLRQAEADRAFGTRPPSWEPVHAAVAGVAAVAPAAGSLADQVETLLLDVVVERVPGQRAFAASLMGLSAPTMKRRLETRAQRLAGGG
jgi:transcriptional regulator with AAA-type ATPase domain